MLFPFLSFAQLDSIAAKQFSDKIASSAKTPLALKDIRNNKRALIFYYDNQELTQKEKEVQEIKGCESCLKVIFFKTEKGLKFSEVTGLFNDLFPTWEREYLSGVKPEQINESFRFREVQTPEGIITFEQKDKFWKIQAKN